jgi:hypothetical protein
MKRTANILIAVVIYVVAIWCVLVYLPFSETPAWLKSLFTKSWQSTLAWMKIRHTFAVVFVGSLLALHLVRHDKRTAQINALVIGAFSVLWGIVFRWAIIGASSLTRVEITDSLAIGLAIPALVAIVNRAERVPCHKPTIDRPGD